jgi:hypothetical protein
MPRLQHNKVSCKVGEILLGSLWYARIEKAFSDLSGSRSTNSRRSDSLPVRCGDALHEPGACRLVHSFPCGM